MRLTPSPFRRTALCAALALSTLGGLAGAALAAAPEAPRQQVPGVYRQAIGRLTVTALFDGVVPLPTEQLKNVDAGVLAGLLDHRYVPQLPKGLQTAVNAYLVQDGAHLTLVDTGTAQCFGPGLGQVLANLRSAGYAPEQVDDVLLTHAHPDHLCGVLDAQGQPAFRNATLWLSAQDAAYWLDPGSEAGAPAMLKFAFPLARTAVAPYETRHRLRRFQPGDALPGAGVVPSYGHTPGHVSYLFDGGDGQRLLVWGDIVHYHAVQFARPEASYEADSNRAESIASRKRLMARASDAGWWVAGAHLPFPGLGHVRRQEGAFDWVPTEFSPLPSP